MDNCIFCKIIKGDIPSTKIYEDDDFLGFLDISKATNGHALLIPKKHCANVLECDDALLEKMLPLAKRLALKMEDKLKAKGFNMLMNTNEVAGQTCFHFHLHIIPRYNENDGFDPHFAENKNPQLSLDEVKELLK